MAQRILRRLPLSMGVARNTRCNAAQHPGIPMVQAVWLVVVTQPNNGEAAWPVNWSRLVEAAWYACQGCWETMARWDGIILAPDGDDEDTQPAPDVTTPDQLMAAAMLAIGQLGAVVNAMDGLRANAVAQVAGAYRERAALLALVASYYPSWWETDPNAPAFPVLMVDTPTGQMSWHINKTDLDLFPHVNTYGGKAWDGHSTDEKYQRLRALVERNVQGHGPFPEIETTDATIINLPQQRAGSE